MIRNLKYSFILYIIVSITVPQPLYGYGSIEVNPREITVGDPVEIVLSVLTSKEAKVIFPSPEQLSPAEALRVDTLSSQGTERSILYTVSFFEPGTQSIPDLTAITNENGSIDSVVFIAGEIEVLSILSAADSTSDIRDIHPPVKLSWTFKEILPFILIAVAIIAVAVVLYILWRKRKQRLGDLPVWTPPPIPPHVIAIDKLIELKEKKLWQNGYIKQFYNELTAILKEYLGNSFKFNAPEMTTFELFEAKNKWEVTNEQFRQMRRILSSGDLVKFAKFKADGHENEKNIENAFDFVEKTKNQIQNEKIEDLMLVTKTDSHQVEQ